MAKRASTTSEEEIRKQPCHVERVFYRHLSSSFIIQMMDQVQSLGLLFSQHQANLTYISTPKDEIERARGLNKLRFHF